MKRILFLKLAALLAAGSFVAGCSDDEDDNGNDTDVTEDTADTTEPEPTELEICTAELEIPTPAEGLCEDEAELYAAVASQVAGVAQSCAIGSCDALNPEADPDEVGRCVSCCVGAELEISPACASCAGAVVVCVVQNCLSACGADANSEGCLECRAENECDAAVEACIGDLSGEEECNPEEEECEGEGDPV